MMTDILMFNQPQLASAKDILMKSEKGQSASNAVPSSGQNQMSVASGKFLFRFIVPVNISVTNDMEEHTGFSEIIAMWTVQFIIAAQ